MEYWLQFAKCLIVNNKVEKSLNILKKVIEKNKYYSVKILRDPDFFQNKLVLRMLENMTQQLIEKVENEMKYLNEIIVINSRYKKQLKKVEKMFYYKTYINARKAAEMLFKSLSSLIRLETKSFEKDLGQKKENLRQIAATKAEEEKNEKYYNKVMTIVTSGLILFIIIVSLSTGNSFGVEKLFQIIKWVLIIAAGLFLLLYTLGN